MNKSGFTKDLTAFFFVPFYIVHFLKLEQLFQKDFKLHFFFFFNQDPSKNYIFIHRYSSFLAETMNVVKYTDYKLLELLKH